MIKLKKKKFTLIEVIIAIAILAIGVVGAGSMISLSKKRMERAYYEWFNKHLLAQAAEYYLLCGGNKSIPSSYFPYTGYTAVCNVSNCNDLSISPVNGSWRLATYDISIKNEYGNVVAHVKIDKIVKQ